MKKYICIFLLLLINYYSYAQLLTEQEYKQLSNLFNIDVELTSNSIDTYEQYKARTKAQTQSYSQSTVLSIAKNSSINSTIKKVMILAESSIYSQLNRSIHRYAYDINYVLGAQVILKKVTGGTHTNIKDLITANKQDLNGVILIGEIAAAWYETPDDHEEYGYASWPCDLYYMDIDGTWKDTDNNGIYDTHTGNVKPEIFIGRISTKNMGNLVDEITGLEKYFNKNHKFWNGELVINKQKGLTYTDKDWIQFDYFKNDIKHLYGTAKYNAVSYGEARFGRTYYLSQLNSKTYEFIQLACHANETRLAMTGGSIYSNEVFNNKTNAIGYNLYCCSAARFTSTSYQGFLAGSHIYNDGTGLTVVGSTKTGSLLNFSHLYTPLGKGKTMGEALLSWWSAVCGNGTPYPLNTVYWYYGLTIIGDPLINFIYTNSGPTHIKDRNITSNETVNGHKVIVDNVTIQNNSKLTINFIDNVTLTNLKVPQGAFLQISPVVP